MTNPKRWPIGLQSSATGRPQGIGEVIKELTEANIAFFSASSDAFSILTDLQIAREARPDVPHTGNFILTENHKQKEKTGYDLSVPEYGKEPSADMGPKHWDSVEELVPIHIQDKTKKRHSPIDWQNPCLWISTWNEIRPYTGWARLDTEKAEDPVGGFEGNADLIGHQAYHIGMEALERGYRWAAFGFAGGDPQENFWEAPGVLKYLRLCAENPDQLGVALHEYSHILRLDDPDKIGRFKLLHDTCDRHNIRRPVIQIKEFGWEATKIPHNPDVAMAQLLPVAEMYMEHPNIHGAAIWTVRPWQGSEIHHQVIGLIPHLRDAALRHAREIPQEQPVAPVDTGPVVIDTQVEEQPLEEPGDEVPAVTTSDAAPSAEWNFSILKHSVEEARKRHKATMSEFGIDVSYVQTDRLDWGQLKEDGVHFAFIRVGSGKTLQDANYVRNVAGCLRHGIPFGNYYYLYEDFDMKQQARKFVHQGDWRSTLPPVLDVEQRALTEEQIKTFIEEFHRLVDSPPIMIYTSVGAWNHIVPKSETWPTKHPLWVANYGTDTPALPHSWDRWVFFQPGVKKGLAGYPKGHPSQSDELDYNHFNGPLHELSDLQTAVRVRDVAFADYLPFDSPVGSDTLRRRKEPLYPGDWYDYNPYGSFYENPSTGKFSYHTGADLNRPADADAHRPVYAAADGEVSFAGAKPVWGNIIVIRHGPSLYSRYGHVDQMRVERGDMVKRGDQIAQVGQDEFGGPFHLHFDISHSDVLGANPGHWPGNNKEVLERNYIDPKDFIERHRPQDTEPPPSPRIGVPTEFRYVTATAGLRLREEAKLDATILDTLPYQSKVGVYSKHGDWYHVRVGDQVGFVWAGHTTATPPDEPVVVTPAPAPVKPKKVSVIGIHGAPGAAAPPRHMWDEWTTYLKEMGVHWYKQLDSSDGESDIFQWVMHLQDNGIEPIIRYYQGQQFPGNLEDSRFRQMKRYADRGVRWAEIGNEPNLAYEWKSEWQLGEPPKMHIGNPRSSELLAKCWIEDAERAADNGVWPAFYAFGPTEVGQWRPNHVFSSSLFTDRVVKALSQHYRDRTIRLFEERSAWIAVHVAKYEQPLDYDIYSADPERPWDMALRGYEVVLNAFDKHFGGALDLDNIPIISTEGGVFVPEHASRGLQGRVPADDNAHAEQTIAMFEYVEKNTPLTAMCPWCIAEGELIGHQVEEFRDHGWFKQVNGSLHKRPIYEKMKARRQEEEVLAHEVDFGVRMEEEAVEAVEAVKAVEVVKAPGTTITIKLQIKVEIDGNDRNVSINVDTDQ